jgi:predicted nucleic acid-binding protein
LVPGPIFGVRLSLLEHLMAHDRFAFAVEPFGIEALWKDFALRESPSPKLWMDAWLTAFAIASGLQLVTIDQAFTRFTGLDLEVLVPG